MLRAIKTVDKESCIPLKHWGRSSTDSCLPVNLKLQKHCDCHKSGSVTLGEGFLTAEMVDTLEGTQQNWIVKLDSEQILDMQGGDAQRIEFKHALHKKQTTADLIAAVPLSLYQVLEVNQTLYWVAMFSCWVGGWGKVRLLVVCQNPTCRKASSLLVTNRLDWSPSRVLRLFFQAYFS